MSVSSHEIPALSGSLPSFMTLEQFIIDHQDEQEHSTGAFTRLIRDISVAAKVINRNIRRAGLLDVFGASGDNSNTVGRYAVYFDPLDGSSNTDVNASVGTIFSVYRLPKSYDPSVVLPEVLQAGSKQVAAGYIAYGSSTILVYTTGDGVNGFTLDPEIGEFVLSHPDIRVPNEAKMYSVNEADIEDFSDALKGYLTWLKRPDSNGKRQIRHRYIGAFVSDFHRNLLTGGIYMYPDTQDAPQGKLRLMYEANPLAFIVEQAGGKASDGKRRILDIVPDDLHQRVPLFIGNAALIDEPEKQLAA